MLHLTINQGDGTPLYLQVARQIKHLIATQRLDPGDKLPSVRALSQQLVINPNTVVRAYRELETDGLIFTMHGSGVYVSEKRVPYSNDERRRIINERADALIVESRNLGFTFRELADVIAERHEHLNSQTKPTVSGEDTEHVNH